ncbi:MAG: hypothetical protein K2G03_00735, partial [Bacilli bacterium]|nr:hypothetical protein [Bacilli bacterium]
YLKALEEKDYIMRLEYLSQLFAMVGIDVDELWDEHIIREKKETNIELKLVYLKDKIEKVESMLISNHPAKDYVYFVLLYKMKRLFWLITDAEIKEVEEEFKRALSVYNVDDRIKYVEAILAHIDKNYNIDYDNYLIKKY